MEQDILNSFRKNGFELISPRFNHMRNFLTCLPFMAGKGLFKQLKEAGVVQRAESFNVANLMPLVADNPLTPAGLLAPTYRNQLAFIDIFFRGMNNTNYNMAVCGTSGAGKTGLIQPLIRSVLDSGGFAVVFDMGDGYKSLCENMGGVYLDGETLRFNPFANITDMDELIAKAWRFVRERFRSYQTELKSRGIKRARARRDANRERQDIVTLVKRQLTREISEGRFTANREAVKREVERRVKDRMILSRNRNYSRLATASP